MTTVLGKDLLIGDTIEVWWRPHRDTITKLIPYTGPLRYLWDKDGGAQLADFALNRVGMTIEPLMVYRVYSRTALPGDPDR